jgi:RNA polymerase sigma factor (TIGR02999 family)
MNDITQVLPAVGCGERQAPEELFPLGSAELRRTAAVRMAGEAAGHTLQPTALVPAASLQLVGDGDRTRQNRRHFFGAAADAMRRILIDNARRKSALKHGGGQERVTIEDLEITATTPDEHILMIGEARQRLEAEDAEKARIIPLKFFDRPANEEVAESLGIRLRTVIRPWVCAKIKRFRRIREPNG